MSGVEKDITTLHNMVDVLNSERGNIDVTDDLNSIKSDIKKLKTDLQNCDKTCSEIKVSFFNK